MSCELIDVADSRWTDALEGTRHDPYHVPNYLRVAAAEEGSRATAFVGRDDRTSLLVPILLRELPETPPDPRLRCDGESPYGYGSPLLVGKPSAQPAGRLLTQLQGTANEIGMVSAFLRLHPLLPLPEYFLDGLGTVLTHGPTVYIDLRLSAEQVWREMRSNHRNDINKLKRKGFLTLHNDWDRYQDFVEIYGETMGRVGASESYMFSRSYFTELKERLSGTLHLFAAVDSNGCTAAAGLFFERCGIIQYHLGGTSPEYLPLSPAKLMFDAVRRWGQESGHEILHFGGGVGAREDSLFRFKAGFGRGRGLYRTARLIFDPTGYDQLVRQRRRRTRSSDPSYFPLYRA